ncbi:MAG: efflux RND transporter permease subunit [Candidatus Omnitrophica bacterium]|nr:efflux RND transporter permease subunit [Candidatus Omnitrophota bacterium]
MSLPSYSVNKPVSITMLYIGIVILGAVSLLRLPVELKPNISYGDISIVIEVRGGMPPQEVESMVTKPIEEAVSTVTHLENVYSTSKAGESRIWLEFEPGINMDFAALETREKFSKIKDKLPREIEKPILAQYKESDTPIMVLAITSNVHTVETLRRVVDEQVKERILRVEGVANVDVYGGKERKILVEIDQARLQAHHVPIDSVVSSLGANNFSLLLGDISKAKNRYLIRAIGTFKSTKDMENIGVSITPQGAVIKLKDVATVKDSYADPSNYARTDIEPVVSIYIQKESTANTIKVVNGIKKELNQIKNIIDKNIYIKVTLNQADVINDAIDAVKSSLISGAFLSVLILLITLRDIRPTFIISVTIPISVMFTFILMYFQKLSLNVMTLSGLALGIGMLVDNSIVVLDNVDKKRSELLPLAGWRDKDKTAVIEGASEMGLAIVASTITTVIVFLPFAFVNKETRMLWSGLAFTVTYSLLTSLFVAMTLVPTLLSQMAAKPIEKKERKTLKKSVAIKIKGMYRKGLVMALRFRYLLTGAAFLMLAVALFFGMKLEKEFMVEAEEGRFTIFVELEPGAKLDVTDKMAKELEEKLANIKEIKTFTSRVEPGSSKIYVKLKLIKDRARSTKEVMDAIRLEGDVVARHYKGGFIYFSELEESGLKELTLDLCGYDYKILKETAISIATRLGSIDGLQDIRMSRISGRPEWLVKIDKQQAGLFGLTTQEVAETLHGEIRGLRATLFHTEAQEIETITRLQKKYRAKVDDVRRLAVYTPEGGSIFLEQIADFVPDIGMSEITRKNKTRVVQITAMVSKGSLQKAVEKVKASLEDMEFPKDYYWKVGGDYERNIKNEKELSALPFSLTLPYVQMPGVLWITLLLVFMVLASLFESLTQPFVILFSVPLAVIGVVAALFISHKPISRGVIIGAIMLAGIVVNNAIILVDRINFLRIKKDGSQTDKYHSILRASIIAGEDRFRPIFMTTSTTILGLVPMAFDRSESANLWSPLAITVIGGLTSSTVMTLFLVPSVYMIFEDFNAIILTPKRLLVFIQRRIYGIIKGKEKPVKNI